jgi:hypothetical protein
MSLMKLQLLKMVSHKDQGLLMMPKETRMKQTRKKLLHVKQPRRTKKAL